MPKNLPEQINMILDIHNKERRSIDVGSITGHPWLCVDGVAPDKPLDSAVLSGLTQFSAWNKLKKIAITVIAETFSEEEIAGLKEMFKMIDADNSGQITLDELKSGLERVSTNLKESEINNLIKANGTTEEVKKIVSTLNSAEVPPQDVVEVVVSPPYAFLPLVKTSLRPGFHVAAQNCWVKKLVLRCWSIWTFRRSLSGTPRGRLC